MRTKRLGCSELDLTVIGLGTWAIGGGGWKYSWGPQDDKQSIKTIHHSLELGINWIDTAPIYGLGHSEQVIGKVIKHLRKKPIIATKCGLVWDQKRKIAHCLNKESIYQEVESSLKRLRVEVIDLYQIHWPLADHDLEIAWETMADLVIQGKVRYLGVANFSVSQLKRIESISPVVSLQPPYSIIERGIEKEILNYCLEKKIGVIIYSPLQKGLLSGAFNRERVASLPQDDHRRKDPNFREPRLTANLRLAVGLEVVAKKNNRSIAQLAIAWSLSNQVITSAIVGARSPQQIEETIKAADKPLGPEEISEIALLTDKYQNEFTLV